MLVTLCRLFIIAGWSLHPVQTTVSVFSQSPCVVERNLVRASTSKNNHHTRGCSGSANTGAVVNSGRRGLFGGNIDFFPSACSKNINFPDVSNSFRASVAAMNDEVGFEVTHNVAVPGSRRGPFGLLDGPKGLIGDIHEIEDVQMFVSQLATSFL